MAVFTAAKSGKASRKGNPHHAGTDVKMIRGGVVQPELTAQELLPERNAPRPLYETPAPARPQPVHSLLTATSRLPFAVAFWRKPRSHKPSLAAYGSVSLRLYVSISLVAPPRPNSAQCALRLSADGAHHTGAGPYKAIPLHTTERADASSSG